MAWRACAALVAIAIAGWLGACQSEAPPPPPAAAPLAAAAATPVAWADAADCRAKLGLLEQAAQAGRLAAGEPVPIAVVLPGSAGADDWLAPPDVTIAADLPLAVHQQSELAQLDAPCLLLIEPPRDQRVEHRVTDRQTVRSFYQSGSRSERNPDYDLAQLRVRQAERDARDDDFDILSVGDPMIDLVGTLIGSVVSGFSQGKGERDLQEAMLELTSTPRSLDQPVYRAYEFEQATVLAGKEATIPIALLERASGRVWRAELRQRERREFAIIDDLDPRDRDYEARRAASLDRHEFERWQREPPRLQLSALAAALRAAAPTAGRSAPVPAAVVASNVDRGADPSPIESEGLDAALVLPARAADRPSSTSGALWPLAGRPIAPASGAAAPGDARAAGVVSILADEGGGSGIYVRDDLVLTTATLVARSSVIEVVAADGAHVLGLVARTDRGRNLALVQVAKPGAPVALHDGPPLAAGRAIEALLQRGAGRTTLASGRYLGAGPATEVSLAAFTDLVYIDAPALQDQPEATPWFLGDALVALGTAAAAERADGPLGAIGAAAIRDFLYGVGGALAALP